MRPIKPLTDVEYRQIQDIIRKRGIDGFTHAISRIFIAYAEQCANYKAVSKYARKLEYACLLRLGKAPVLSKET